MPIYAYACEQCGHQQDVLQKLSDPHLAECPACGQASFRRQLTAAGFVLKGGGWYATDFKNGGAKSAASPAAAPAAESAPKADSGGGHSCGTGGCGACSS